MRTTVAGAILLVLLLGHGQTFASTILKRSLAQMVQEADEIVIGTPIRAETVWVGREIFTRYTIEVEETILGNPRTTTTVLAPGGIDRSRRIPIGMVVAGAPVFVAHERVVLLLEKASMTISGDFRIVGFNQGRFTVVGDRVTTPAAPGVRARRTASEPVRALRARLQQLVRSRRPR